MKAIQNKNTILKLVAATLMAAFTLPIFMQAAYFMHIKHIEYKMEQALETKQLTTITLHVNEIVWAKKSKEIIYNNQLFDIKKITIKNNKAIITGLYDIAEKPVKEKAEALVKNQKTNSNKMAQNYFQIQLYVDDYTTDENVYYTVIHKIQSPLFSFFYTNALIEIQTPPPNNA